MRYLGIFVKFADPISQLVYCENFLYEGVCKGSPLVCYFQILLWTYRSHLLPQVRYFTCLFCLCVCESVSHMIGLLDKFCSQKHALVRFRADLVLLLK